MTLLPLPRVKLFSLLASSTSVFFFSAGGAIAVLQLWGKLISYNRGGGVGGSGRLISHSQIEYISYVFIELQLVLSAISQCQSAPSIMPLRGRRRRSGDDDAVNDIGPATNTKRDGYKCDRIEKAKKRTFGLNPI